MILLDTEGTCLSKPETAPLHDQPHLVEFGAVKLDDRTLKRKGEPFFFRCNPGVPLPEEFVRITGITEEMVKTAPPLVQHFSAWAEFFLGETTMVAHNCEYDRQVMMYALMRIGKLTNFPWPRIHICTVEASRGIRGHNLSLSDLVLMAEGRSEETRVQFREGMTLKHKSLGLCTITAIETNHLHVEVVRTRQHKQLEKKMFRPTAAFEEAHGAMKDALQLEVVVPWLRKEGWL